ncbi:MAG: TetR/AcrR family transcriptional regulator [Actinomycetota bacterium]|nr:TetR/AcrR family transcriptional regulator [Actinomycetota bacterium]
MATNTERKCGGPDRLTARDRLLAAAGRRFYQDGIASTGVDKITAEAGVAKMSLYNNFSSKADLVRAYLEARHDEWLSLYRSRLQRAQAPADRVLAVFDAYLDHAAVTAREGFRGCGLLNASGELASGDPGRAAVQRHKQEVEDILFGHLVEDVLPGQTERARAVSEHLSFVLEGAVARAGLDEDANLLNHARRIAVEILENL